MKKADQDAPAVAGAIIAAAVITAVIVLIALPGGYILKVLVQTRSQILLAATLILSLTLILAACTHAVFFLYIGGVLLLASLVIARIEQVRLGGSEPPSEQRFFPFGRYDG
jgi:uncharacterized membrane protein